ncbi:MAG: CBS domain-containing protein [Hyphomicrobiaceae bacterium]|nr:CBS domain-containing protein [Hyphomicrobiaceae bacterium]
MSMYRFLECRVDQYMTRDVVVISPQATLRDLEALFAARDFNAVPVVENDGMVGVVTKFDFLKAFAFTTRQMVPHYDELMSTLVGQVMTRSVVDVEPEAPLTRVLQQMVDLRARSFPVRERDGRLAGIISREDIMRALADAVAEPEPACAS